MVYRSLNFDIFKLINYAYYSFSFRAFLALRSERYSPILYMYL